MDKEKLKDEIKKILWEKEMNKMRNRGSVTDSTIDIENRLDKVRHDYKKILLDEVRKEEGKVR